MAESSRLRAVQTPIIPVIGDLARATPGTISLGQGMVSYGPPPQAVERAARAMSQPSTHQYSAVGGLPALVEALSAKLRDENGLPMSLEATRLVVTAGANMGFVNAVLAIADPGDEIVLQAPFYFNHEMAVVMAGCRPVVVPTDARYQPSVGALEAAITPRTRAIVSVSPNNPTGAVYPEETLRAIDALCRARGVYHISDETYEYFTYDGSRHFSPGSIPGSAAHTIGLYSLSKAYGFAGWRIGYMTVPEHLAGAVQKIQDTVLICPPVVSQHAALGALEEGSAYCRDRVGVLASVRDLALRALAGIADICTVPAAQGAFYLLLNIAAERDSFDVAARLIREHRVAVIPGSAFGASGCHLRVSYGALQKDDVAEGIGRLVEGLRHLVRT